MMAVARRKQYFRWNGHTVAGCRAWHPRLGYYENRLVLAELSDGLTIFDRWFYRLEVYVAGQLYNVYAEFDKQPTREELEPYIKKFKYYYCREGGG